MHMNIADFNLGPDDFLKALPLGYGPKGLYYHPEKPLWLITRAMFSHSRGNCQFQEIPEEKAVWLYTDDPQMVVLNGFTLPAHPCELQGR